MTDSPMSPVRIYFWENGDIADTAAIGGSSISYAYHNHERVASLQVSCNRWTSRVDRPALGRLIARESALYFFCRWYGDRSVVSPSTESLFDYYTNRAEAA